MPGRSRTLLAIGMIAIIWTATAAAAEDEDHRAVCPLLTEKLVSAILPDVTGHGTCKVRCEGCGCKGGPGYRAADGRCVGYADIIRKCGPPPHQGCRAECAPVAVGCDHGRVWLKDILARAGLTASFVAAAPRGDHVEPAKVLAPAQ